jgi:hypothetical protein
MATIHAWRLLCHQQRSSVGRWHESSSLAQHSAMIPGVTLGLQHSGLCVLLAMHGWASQQDDETLPGEAAAFAAPAYSHACAPCTCSCCRLQQCCMRCKRPTGRPAGRHAARTLLHTLWGLCHEWLGMLRYESGILWQWNGEARALRVTGTLPYLPCVRSMRTVHA